MVNLKQSYFSDRYFVRFVLTGNTAYTVAEFVLLVWGPNMTNMARVHFDTSRLAVKDQFASWADSSNSMYWFDRPHRYDAPFHHKVDLHISPAMSAAFIASRHSFSMRRDKWKIAQDGLDSLGIQFSVSGIERHINDDYGRDPIKPGDLCLIDMTQPFGTNNDPREVIVLGLKRADVEAQLPDIRQLHRQRLGSGPLAAVFKSYLMELKKTLPQASDYEAEKISNAGAMLAIDLLRMQDIRTLDSSDISNGSVLQAIRLCIHKHHAKWDLNPDFIAKQVGISRSKLYSVCKPFDSPMDMVRSVRLAEAAKLLRQGRDNQIYEIAFMVGFSDRETFTRAFKQTYGIAPTDYRHEMLAYEISRPTGGQKTSNSAQQDLTPAARLMNST